MKHILNAAKVIFSLLVLTFTSWQTYNLLKSVVGGADPITPLVGVALFAGGFVFWSNLYIRDKESTAVQHAAALGGAVLCMVLDATGAALHLLVGGQTLVTVDQNIGWWIIGIIVLAAALNIGLLFVHETHSQAAIEQRRAANERHQEEEAQDQRGDLRNEYRQAEIDFERDVVKDTIRELKAQKRSIAQKLAQDRAQVAAANLLASMNADPARYLGAAQAPAQLAAPMQPATAWAVSNPATAAAGGGEGGGDVLQNWWQGLQTNLARVAEAASAATTPPPTTASFPATARPASNLSTSPATVAPLERWEEDPPAPARRWALDDLLASVGMTREQARAQAGDYSAGMVYSFLKDRLPEGMTRPDFEALFAEMKQGKAAGALAEVQPGPKAPTSRPRKARG